MASEDLVADVANRRLEVISEGASAFTNLAGLILGLGAAVASLAIAGAGSTVGKNVALAALGVMFATWMLFVLADRRVGPDELGILKRMLDHSDQEIRRELIVAALASVELNERILGRAQRASLIMMVGLAVIVIDAFVVLA